jgi:hypothetical protein
MPALSTSMKSLKHGNAAWLSRSRCDVRRAVSKQRPATNTCFLTQTAPELMTLQGARHRPEQSVIVI